MMKVLILNQFNTPFELTDLPKPQITSQQVLIKVVASGVNPIDLQIKAGMVPFAQLKLPNAVLGTDMSGIITAVGKDVKNFTMGEAVFGMAGGVADIKGTLAEYVAADPALLAKKPNQLSFKEAAALPLYAITAWEAIVDRGAVRKKDSVLIQGGAGGVGHLAIQIAQARGAEVFATGTSKQANKQT
jgi:NADPH2:quinone reductase